MWKYYDAVVVDPEGYRIEAEMTQPHSSASLMAILLVFSGAGLLPRVGRANAADDPCAKFSWNVSHERSLFAAKARSAKAGADLATAPLVAADHLYDLTLTPQEQVHFAIAPGKKPKSDGAFAGLVRLRVATAGLYRISVDQPFWIDVVAGEEFVGSTDFQGASGCNAPHKVVQFMLPAAKDLVLQVSGTASSHAQVTITLAPPAVH